MSIRHRAIYFLLPLAVCVFLYEVYNSFILRGNGGSNEGKIYSQHYSRLEFNEETSASRDKISIRVNIVDGSEESFKKFVSHYTECSAVSNILLLPLKQAEKVVFTVKPYRKVKWLKLEEDISDISTNNAILLIDSDVMIPCSDLEFAYSVWLSARDSAVGFFPRLVIEEKNGKFEYLGPIYVWWQVVVFN